MNATEQFRDAIRRFGLTPPDRIEAGRFHRFPGIGKGNGNRAGWCKLFPSGIGGVFGDYSHDLSEQWQAELGRPKSLVEIEGFRELARKARAEAEAKRLEEQAEAAYKAAAVWEAASPADDAHPYLVRKGIKPHGARIAKDGRLMIPLRADGELHSLQSIDGEGGKRFLPSGRKKGCWHLIGTVEGAKALCIAEGFSTAASIHEATGHPVAIAFDAGNLELVARALRAKFQSLRLVLCADDDWCTEGNPGLTKARAAAAAVHGVVAVPTFGPDRGVKQTDFNDVHAARGLDAVRTTIMDALERPTSDDRAEDGATVHAPADDAAAGDSDGAAPVFDEAAPPAGDDAPAGPEWPEPHPLPDALSPVDAFDSALLPVSLRAWCYDISERVQCPPDFVAVAAVAALGAVLGRKVAIRPQRFTPWSEVANQWAMVIGRPGVMKSPAIERALEPVRRLEATAREKHAIESRAYQADEAARKLRAKANEHDAAKAIAKNRNADVRELLHDPGDYAEIPICKRYSTSDTSVQSLAELVRLNPNGLLVHRDEMVSLLRDLDREEKAGDRGFYLTGWNGSTPYTVDRIGRGLDLHIPAVCLSLLGGTQPARLASYVQAAMHGGAGDDGLIQRFGLMVWPDLAGDWRNIDRCPDTKAKRDAFDAFIRLDELTPESVGAEQDTDFNGDPAGPPFLRLDDAALSEFVEWRVELERRVRSSELSPALESHLAKYRKLVPSLALLFHVADGHGGAIGLDSMLRALAWSDYLESHARRVYGSGQATEAATARAILTRIRKGDLPAVFAGWEVWRPGWAGLADRAAVGDGLALLVDLGHLAVGRIKTSGREATRYTVNPRALQ